MNSPEAVAASAVDLSTIPVEKLVRKFVQIRDMISEHNKAAEAAEQEMKAAQTAIENELLKRAGEQGVDGFNTQFGTTYKATDMQVSIADDNAFYATPNAIEMLQRRVSTTAVKKYMDDHEGRVPPGLNVFNQVRMKIRRSNKSTTNPSGE